MAEIGVGQRRQGDEVELLQLVHERLASLGVFPEREFGDAGAPQQELNHQREARLGDIDQTLPGQSGIDLLLGKVGFYPAQTFAPEVGVGRVVNYIGSKTKREVQR